MRTHLDTQADVTTGALPVDDDKAGAFGIMRPDDDGRVRGFLENPRPRRNSTSCG